MHNSQTELKNVFGNGFENKGDFCLIGAEMDFESFACLNFRDVASRRCFPLRFSFTEQPLKTLYTPLNVFKN